MARYWNLMTNISNWHLHFMNKLGLIKDDPLLFIAKNNIAASSVAAAGYPWRYT